MKNIEIYAKAKMLAARSETDENHLVAVLIEIQERETYRDFGYDCKGLFTYATKHLNLTEAVAHSYRTVVNHAIKLPELKQALQTNSLSMAYASKIASSFTEDNVSEVLAYAISHSVRQTQAWLVKEKGVLRKVALSVSTETVELLRDVTNLFGGNPTQDEILQKIIKEYRQRHDPVEKAKRAQENAQARDESRARSHSSTAKPSGVTKVKKRTPLTAAQVHAINHRDKGRCVFHEKNGERCGNRRWLHKHHMITVFEGGSNGPENVILLCPEHHDLVHQLEFDFEMQNEWLKSVHAENLIDVH